MNWRNIQLVWHREMRDQLRDRRTLLVIGVLPLLIYPMMGIVFFRISQFMQHHDARVTIIGSQQLSEANSFHLYSMGIVLLRIYSLTTRKSIDCR